MEPMVEIVPTSSFRRAWTGSPVDLEPGLPVAVPKPWRTRTWNAAMRSSRCGDRAPGQRAGDAGGRADPNGAPEAAENAETRRASGSRGRR